VPSVMTCRILQARNRVGISMRNEGGSNTGLD
jgi:hypothetical protein